MNSRNLGLSLICATTLSMLGNVEAAELRDDAAQPAATVSAADIQALKAQLAALQSRLAELEAAQKSPTPPQEPARRPADSATKGAAGASDWVSRWQWKGDLRYRSEFIDQEFTARDRYRDRLRARFGFAAKVNETVRVTAQMATTESGDARGSNATLTDSSSRKSLDLDMAYAEWSPNATWKLSLGKMPYAWVRTSSYFYDGDVNPEGVAVHAQQGATGLFGSAFVARLAERGTFADSNMFGAQVGWRGAFGDGGRYVVAAGYFDGGAVQGYNVTQSGAASNFLGNSTTTSAAICRSGNSPCLANDFDIVEVLGEVQFKVAGRPLTLFADYARNGKADFSNPTTNTSTSIPAGLDTAYAAGVTYGKASAPGSWEIGYVYQKVEKDALFGQWVDSDFAAGTTDASGSAVRFAYAFAKSWRVNVTLFDTQTNNDVAAAVTVPVARNVFDREYRRLQVDLNVAF